MNWLNSIPLIRLTIPFCFGIALSFYSPNPPNTLFFFTLFLPIPLLVVLRVITSVHTHFKWRWVFGVLLSILFGYFGYFNAIKRVERFHPNHFSQLEKTGTPTTLYTGVISEEPEQKQHSQKAILHITAVKKDSWTPAVGKVLIYLQNSDSSTLSYGDVILFYNSPKPVSPPNNFDEFDYQHYLSHHYIYHQIFLKKNGFVLIENNPPSILKSTAIKCRHLLLDRYTDFGIGGNELAILSALTLGKKEHLNAEIKSAYSRAGAMHVLAVSGLHVGIILLILKFSLRWLDSFKYGKWAKVLILVLSIWGYAFITGMSPSVIRAATMFSFMIVALHQRKSGNIFNTIALSALVILMFEPYMLFEVGFQLSYLAVFGIVLIHPFLYPLIHTRIWLFQKTWEITSVSISAQIATAPLAILYFHQFPTYFLFSNLLVIPSAFLLISLAITFHLVSFISLFGEVVAWIISYILKTLNKLVGSIELLPHSLLDGLDIFTYEAWLSYLLILTLFIWVIKRNPPFLLYSLFLFLMLTLSQTIERWTQLHQVEFVIYHMGKDTFIENNYHDKKQWFAPSSLLQDPNKLQFHVLHHSWRKGLKTHPEETLHLSSKSGNAITFGKIRLMEITPDFRLNRNQLNVFQPSILLINTYKYWDLKELQGLTKETTCIIGSQSTRKVAQQIATLCDSLKISCFSLQENGSIKFHLSKDLSEIQSISLRRPR